MMNQEDFVKLANLRRQGWTIREIAAETGYHPATISKWLREGPPPTLGLSAAAAAEFRFAVPDRNGLPSRCHPWRRTNLRDREHGRRRPLRPPQQRRPTAEHQRSPQLRPNPLAVRAGSTRRPPG